VLVVSAGDLASIRICRVAILVLGLILPLSSGQFEGLGRYCSVLFPVPILFASFHGETRHLGLIAGSAMLYALGLALFVNVHPLF
jgi:hypothetical protein